MIAQYSQMVKQRQENSVLRARQRLGKYRIERRLAQGGFAYVYAAMDTIEGVRVALKMPHQEVVTPSMLECFQREARLVAKLDHPHILPLKDASFIDGRFVIASRLGERSLNDRLRKRMSFETALELSMQMVSAVAYAHKQKIIHCDIKPENMILLPDGRLQLAISASPKLHRKPYLDRALAPLATWHLNKRWDGRAPRRCILVGADHVPDVYRAPADLSFEWPFKGHASLRRRAHPELIAIIRRAMEHQPHRRFHDAEELLTALQKVKRKALLFHRAKK